MLDSSLEVTVGDGVRFRFTVVNPSDRPVEVTFRDACRVDFAVFEGGATSERSREDGDAVDDDEVWRFSDGRAFAQSLSTADLQPGETAVFEEAWPNPEPGDYTAEASLRVREHDVSARTPFSV